MDQDIAARVAERQEWESQRARAAMAAAEARQLAAEERIARAEEQRREEEHPAPDPAMLAFKARMTGEPEPPTVAEILARAAMLPPERESVRGDVDPSAAYGSEGRPALMIDGREIAPRTVQRSDGWEYELDRQLARARDASLRMTEYLTRTDYAGTMAAARAKAARGISRSAAPDPGTWQEPYCRGCGALADSCRCREISR